MRVYEIATGDLYDDLPSGLAFVGHGSSGFMEAMNDPFRQGEKSVGPLPAGAYEIGDQYDDPHLGPGVMRLTPLGPTDVLGRDGSTFRVHGMSRMGAAASSHGCLIFDPIRRKVIAEGSRLLIAVSSLRKLTSL